MKKRIRTIMLHVKFCLLLFIVTLFLGFSSGDASSVEKIEFDLEGGEIAFTFLELPDGEASLIQTNDGKNILINTGGVGSEEELLDRLEMYNVLEIDMLIMTKDDLAHNSNLEWIFKSYIVKNVVVAESYQETFKDHYPYDGFTLDVWKEGEVNEIIPGLKTKLLYEGPEGGEMIFTISYGAHDIFYTNISDDEIEKQVLKKYDIRADIIKIADFAISGGTTQYFLDEINPDIAIIFHRRDKGPSQSIMERLNETWIDIYQTKQFGNITIRCDKENYEVITIPVKHPA